MLRSMIRKRELSEQEKILCWGIWIIGYITPAIVPLCVNAFKIIFQDGIGYVPRFSFIGLLLLPFYLLVVSFSFLGLAVYAKNVFANANLSENQLRSNKYGIICAFLLTLFCEIWNFWPSVLRGSVFLFFPYLSAITMLTGFISGAFICVAITKIKKPDKSTDGKYE